MSSMGARPACQIRVNRREEVTDSALLDEKLQKIEPEYPVCYFPHMYPAEANPTWTARKNDMKYSGWKLMAVAKAIQGKHLLEALAAINASDKKGADIIKATLMAARKNGERKGFNEERMFVQRAIVHKKFSHKKMDIKGRGRTGLIQVPKCDLVVTLEEKQPADYYKMVMKGETPQGIASTIRKMMYQNNADLATVQAMSHLTTSEGRYYRRTQFKRLVQMVKSEYQARGISMKEDKIERNLLEKATGEFLQLQSEAKQRNLLTSRAARQEIFEKNYKKK